MTDNPKTSLRRDYFFAFVVIGTVLATLTLKTWRKWPELVIDFGAQLYMPWQISTGAVMGRDFYYLPGGPLSQHYHALLFKIFGVSLLTLVVSNLVVLMVLLTVIYLCFRRSADQLTAITICVVVMVVFAFGHYTRLSVFNYLTPYSAEIVHGLVLSALAVALLARWIETDNAWVAGAAGLCGGLTLLTKPDLFLALVLTLLCGVALFWRVKRKEIPPGRSLALMLAGGLIPALGFFLWFFRVEDFHASLRAVFGAWIPLLTTSAANSPYYRWGLGLDKPWVHVRHIAHQFLGLACLVAACALASWRKIPRWLAGIVAAAVAIGVIKISWGFNWFTCGYALPPVCLTLLALLVWRGIKTGWEPPTVFAILWTIWSLAVMAKMGVFCRVWHYGFALAMPAFVSGLYLLLWALPRQLDCCNVCPALFRGLVWLILLPGFAWLTQDSLTLYEYKHTPIGSGADAMISFDPSFRSTEADMATALRWIETNVPPDATLAVLPQGVMLNYLSRHTNPFGYVAWNPPEQAAFGQEKMTAALIAHSPDYLIELYVDYDEYGETYFGQRESLGLKAQQWIDAHYQPAYPTIDHDWVKDNKFGIKILRRYRD